MRPAVFPPTMQMNVTKMPPLENSSKVPEHLPSPKAGINDPPKHATTTSEWMKLVVGEKKGGEEMLRKESLVSDTTGSQGSLHRVI